MSAVWSRSEQAGAGELAPLGSRAHATHTRSSGGHLQPLARKPSPAALPPARPRHCQGAPAHPPRRPPRASAWRCWEALRAPQPRLARGDARAELSAATPPRSTRPSQPAAASTAPLMIPRPNNSRGHTHEQGTASVRRCDMRDCVIASCEATFCRAPKITRCVHGIS